MKRKLNWKSQLRIFLLACLVGGCQQDVPEQTNSKWINEEEIAALKKELSEIIEDNRSQRCPRPVLRGKPVDGPAEKDMVVVLDLEQELAACRKLLFEKSEELSEALFYPEGKTHPGYPPRSGLTVRRLDDPPASMKDVRLVEKTCAPIVDRIIEICKESVRTMGQQKRKDGIEHRRQGWIRLAAEVLYFQGCNGRVPALRCGHL